MGVHGSATCVMNFDGATGMAGRRAERRPGGDVHHDERGAASCGNQGLAQAELAYQNAAAYVTRAQAGPGAPAAPRPADPLIVHPDVRRMLMDARAFTEGMRALVAVDRAADRPGRTARRASRSAPPPTRWSGSSPR